MGGQIDGGLTDNQLGHRFSTLIHSLEGIIWESDPAGWQFSFVSRYAETLLGFPLHEWKKPGFWAGQVHPEDRSWVVNFCSTATARGENHAFTYRFMHRDGRPVWLRDNVTLVRDAAGSVTGLQGVMIDVSAQVEAEQALRLRERELQGALADAEAAQRAKSMLLANMSHEFRTPLNAILGFSEMMAKEMFGPLGNNHYKEYAGHILDCGQHLLSLVNDVLDLSRIEAGKYEIHRVPIETHDFLVGLLPFIDNQAERKGLALTLDCPEDLPRVAADRKALLQILLNLLSNAVKFTQQGTVRIGAHAAPGQIVFFVSDTGPGIPPADLNRIMLPFEQVQTGYSKTQAGTGLGLTIAKRLAELSGGSLEVESALGEGTTVRLRLPVW